MNKEHHTINSWEERFDEKFPSHGHDNSAENEFHSQLLKTFIASEREAAYRQGQKDEEVRRIENINNSIADILALTQPNTNNHA